MRTEEEITMRSTGDIDTKGDLASAKFYQDYSRWIEGEGRYETWEESVTRVMDMHREFYAKKMSEPLTRLIDEAEALYKLKYALGAQRALQFGGDQIFKHNFRIYNCVATHACRPEFIGQFFYVLLCGCGAGVSVQKHHVAKLPKIAERKGQAKMHEIEDSIEGWATAMDVLTSSFFVDGGKYPEYQGRRVYFDTSKVRPEGAPISGGFRAPGPEPLRKALDQAEHLLQGLVLEGKDTLEPIHVYDICMFIADSVIAGGVRRSATIFLFSPDDEDMAKAKTGEWWHKTPWRQRSNNSALVVRDEITREEFSKLMQSVKEFGEPGFVFVDDREHATNPCVTADTMVLTSEGRVPVGELIGKPFTAQVNGESHACGTGFVHTGDKEAFRLALKNGMSVKATANHRILTADGWKELKDLEEGKDEVILNEMPAIGGIDDQDDFEKGYLVGSYHGDGTNMKNDVMLSYWNDSIGTASAFVDAALEKFFRVRTFMGDRETSSIRSVDGGRNRRINFVSRKLARYCEEIGAKESGRIGTKANGSSLEKMSPSFKLGYIAGIFDADGTGLSNADKGISMRIVQTDLGRLEQIQRMLVDLGILSTIYKNRRGEDRANALTLPGQKNPSSEYHELHVSSKSLTNLLGVLPLQEVGKWAKLKEAVEAKVRDPYYKKFASGVEKIEPLGVEPVYDAAIDGIHRFDANGIIVHNCAEIGLLPYLETGKSKKRKSGWQACNLTEINGSKCVTKEEFFKACRVGAILGTLQAGYTDFKFVGDVTEKIVEREALLGVSITGWMNNPNVLFDEDTLREGARLIKEVNREVAALIGINPAARCTTVKPSGNASTLLETASGIHAEHSPRYLRMMETGSGSDIAKVVSAANPYMVEENLRGSGQKIAFPVIVKEGSIFKDGMTAIEFLEKVRLVQRTWIEEGTDESVSVDPRVRHNVSNTVQVAPDEWDAVEEYLFENRASFAGVSLLPAMGDKDYAQAPFTEVLTEEELLARYGRAAFFASGLVVDALKGGFKDLWDACDHVIHDLELKGEARDAGAEWIRRLRKFADTNFGGDVKEASYCLKDVHLLHKWSKIQQNMNPIDFSNGLKTQRMVDIDTTGASACQGGGCEI